MGFRPELLPLTFHIGLHCHIRADKSKSPELYECFSANISVLYKKAKLRKIWPNTLCCCDFFPGPILDRLIPDIEDDASSLAEFTIAKRIKRLIDQLIMCSNSHHVDLDARDESHSDRHNSRN